MTQGIGYAHGKIILMGEHAVVYGEPAVAIPFPAVKIKATVEKNQGKTSIDCLFYKGLVDEMPELLESLHKAIDISLQKIKKNDWLTIKIESTIPAERGMGSSAAVAVAVTRAIFDYYDCSLTDEQLLEIVNEAEKIAHGNPSGLDALMTSSHVPYYYIKNQELSPFDLNLHGVLVVGDTGITGKTKEAVQDVADKVKHSPETYGADIRALGQLARESLYFLENDLPEELGKHMSAVHKLLRDLGVSSKELEQLITAALSAGALGAKLTGGGRGGCMIALGKDKKHGIDIAQSLANAGAAETWIFEMNGGSIID
ncbi:mevalonate kinase [Vagococcus elongatus]|uniref:Mevalonate kinase n=1 Tax=Vagococcus elongatus TaxID=180344 RepID=A0A430B5W7_9ENTE|nr:mevalonate kinase [Vagococcus elongatus]RSU15698.1 mevalonate kinase [Vagococcus elongatus]